MNKTVIYVDRTVYESLLGRKGDGDSFNAVLRRMLKLSPPRSRGWAKGKKRQGERGKAAA